MRVLIDTNILVDLTKKFDGDGLAEPDLFEQVVGRNPFLVSVVSIWEIAIKRRLGKIEIPIAVEQLGAMVRVAGGILLDIGEDHILAPITPEPGTKDPFDRLLLTTAAAEGALLLTRDRALQSHPLVWQPLHHHLE